MENTGKEGHSGTQYPPGTNEAGPLPTIERRTGSEAESFPPTEDAGSQPAVECSITWRTEPAGPERKSVLDGFARRVNAFAQRASDEFYFGTDPVRLPGEYRGLGAYVWDADDVRRASEWANARANEPTWTEWDDAPATDDADASTTTDADADDAPHPAWNRTWYRPRFR
jgi:hypothetical protein